MIDGFGVMTINAIHNIFGSDHGIDDSLFGCLHAGFEKAVQVVVVDELSTA